MVEEFRPVKDYERYYISDLGRVINTETGKFLKMTQKANGYFSVMFCVNGTQKRFLVHRLVAQAFIDNPNNYDTVDHINGIKTDNRMENLQWLSRSENSKKFHQKEKTEEQKEHYKTVGKENLKRATEVCKKPVICVETGKIYESTHQAERELNIYRGCVGKVCRGKQEQIHGLHFEYLL